MSNPFGGSVQDTVLKLTENTLFLSLSFSRPGNKRQLAASQYSTVAVDKARTKATKTLLECEELNAIGTHDNVTRAEVQALTTPSDFFDGVYMLRKELRDEVEKYLEQRLTERQALVEAFLAVYPEARAEAQQALGPLFSEGDYPPEDKIRTKFAMSWQFLTFAATGPDKDKLDRRYLSAAREATKLLLTETCEVCEHFRAKLERYDDPKTRLHQSTIDGVNKFFYRLGSRNVIDSPVVAKVLTLWAGQCDKDSAFFNIDPVLLRQSKSYRESCAEAVNSILTYAGDALMTMQAEEEEEEEEGGVGA